MKELFKAVNAIHQGFTMTGYEWEPEWTSDCSQTESQPSKLGP